VCFQKTKVKNLQTFTEVKLLMFSKENSSEEISFAQRPQKEDRAMGSRLKKENEIK
tara:strand:- start:322 stop:489 length:168 start_codon:yes stop_codon:yes gene_type:complete